MKILIIGLGSIGQRHLRNIVLIFTQNKVIKKYFPFKRNDLFLNEVKFFLNHVKKNKKIDKDLSILNGIKTLEFCLNLKKKQFHF